MANSFYKPIINIPDTTSGFDVFGTKGLFDDINKTNQQINSMNLPQPKPKNPFRQQQIGNMLLAFSDVVKGRDPSAGVMQRKTMLDAQKKEDENKKLIESMNPEMQKIFKTFGPNAAFQYQQQQLAAESAGLEELRKIKGLKDSGFSEREINLFLNADMKAKDIIELRDVDSDQIKSLEQLNKEIDNQYVLSEGLQVIDQAFSVKDTIDNAFNKLVGPIFGTPAQETNSAINARNILNESLRERFVNQYSGRPSVYLNQRIDTLLPMGTYNSEFDAMQKYQEIKRVLDQGKTELQENINSGMFEGTELLTLQNEYKSTSYLLKDLNTVIGNLKKDEQTKIDVVDDDKNIQNFGQFGPFFGVTE